MLEFLAHLVVTAILLLVIAYVVKGIRIDGFGPALFGALVLGILNGIVRPLSVVLSLPLVLLTFGLFLFVLNALMLWLMSAIVPGIKINGFGPAFLGALLLSVLNVLVRWIAD